MASRRPASSRTRRSPRSTSPASRTTRSSRHRLRRDLGQQRARERLVPLDLRSRPRRADRARALREQRVDHAGRQRLVGADHRDVDLVRARERGHRAGVQHVADLTLPPDRARSAPSDGFGGRRTRTARCAPPCGRQGRSLAHRDRRSGFARRPSIGSPGRSSRRPPARCQRTRRGAARERRPWRGREASHRLAAWP